MRTVKRQLNQQSVKTTTMMMLTIKRIAVIMMTTAQQYMTLVETPKWFLING